jgi:methylglyoxal synthase
MIALIAHDQMKKEMVEFCRAHLEFLRQSSCVATGTTGALLHSELGLNVERVPHGPSGGDLVIGGMVAQDQVHAVIFFRDALTAQPHEPDIAALMRVCDVHNIPLATNPATAASIIEAMKND